MKKSFWILSGLGVLGMIGYYVFVRWGIIFVFGEGFLVSVFMFRILVFVVLFMFLNLLFGSFLNVMGRELMFIKIMGFIVLLNVVLNYFLILNYGVRGVVMVMVVS